MNKLNNKIQTHFPAWNTNISALIPVQPLMILTGLSKGFLFVCCCMVWIMRTAHEAWNASPTAVASGLELLVKHSSASSVSWLKCWSSWFAVSSKQPQFASMAEVSRGSIAAGATTAKSWEQLQNVAIEYCWCYRIPVYAFGIATAWQLTNTLVLVWPPPPTNVWLWAKLEYAMARLWFGQV